MSAAPNLLHQVVAALQGIGFRDPECLGSAELAEPVGSTRAFRKLNGFLMSSNRLLRRDLLMPFEGVECGCWIGVIGSEFRWLGFIPTIPSQPSRPCWPSWRWFDSIVSDTELIQYAVSVDFHCVQLGSGFFNGSTVGLDGIDWLIHNLPEVVWYTQCLLEWCTTFFVAHLPVSRKGMVYPLCSIGICWSYRPNSVGRVGNAHPAAIWGFKTFGFPYDFGFFYIQLFTSKNLMSIRGSTHTKFGEVDKKYGFSHFGDPKLEQFPKSREIPNLFLTFPAEFALNQGLPALSLRF